MRKYLLLLLILPALGLGCNQSEKKYPQTDMEVATAFIRALLDNKLNEADQYILKDETNNQYFDIIKQQYAKKDKSELEKYKNAEILVNETSYITDSVLIMNYSNSYNKALRNKVKVIRQNGKWLIDLKYTFSGNM